MPGVRQLGSVELRLESSKCFPGPTCLTLPQTALDSVNVSSFVMWVVCLVEKSDIQEKAACLRLKNIGDYVKIKPLYHAVIFFPPLFKAVTQGYVLHVFVLSCYFPLNLQ